MPSMPLLVAQSTTRCLRAVSAAVTTRGGELSSAAAGAGLGCGCSTASVADEFVNLHRAGHVANPALKRTRNGGPGFARFVINERAVAGRLTWTLRGI